jgi:hypothetical protein
VQLRAESFRLVQSIYSCCSADTIVPQLRIFADPIEKCGEQVGVENNSRAG